VSCPLLLELPPDVTASNVLETLQSAGIAPVRCAHHNGHAAWICRRGPVSFRLVAYDVEGRTHVWFTADLTGWRWWNFPVMWLLAIRYTSREIQLQRDAYFALRAIGAARLVGGDVLGLDNDDR